MITPHRWYLEPKWTPVLSGVTTITLGVILLIASNGSRNSGRTISLPAIAGRMGGITSLSERSVCVSVASTVCLAGAACVVASLLSPHSIITPLRFALGSAWTCLLACLLICVASVFQLLRDELTTLLAFAWFTTPAWAFQFFFVRNRIHRLLMETNPPNGFPIAASVIPPLCPVRTESPASKVGRFLRNRKVPTHFPQRSDNSR